MGSNCDSALYLRSNGLRSFSGPVDWVISASMPQLIQQIDTRFVHCMKLENLKLIGSVYGHFSVEDTATGILSFHDFPVPPDQSRQIVNYPDFKAHFDRKVDRFYKSALASRKALYVRMQANVEEAESLRLALERISGGEVYLLVANYAELEDTSVHEEDWDVPFITAVQIPLTESLRPAAWQNVLSGFVLDGKL